MGRMKELAMEYDEAFEIIGSLKQLLLNNEILETIRKSRYLNLLKDTEYVLEECRELSNVSAPTIVTRYFRPILESAFKEGSIDKVRILPRLSMCLAQLRDQLASKQTILNSQEYYEKEILELKKNISNLMSEISSLQDENTESKSLLDQKEELLNQQSEKLLDLNKDREELIRREDARKDWSKKITDAFSTLQKGLKPIKSEKKRLNWMYFIYGGFCVALIGLLIAIEIIMTCKLRSYHGIPPFYSYLSLVAPIPVVLALLFVFISQINRTQRQLVAISKYIHDIEYTEEIMQSINSLSVNIEDSMSRINESLDKLLDRHLACNLNYLEEVSLKEQENKDKDLMPVGQVVDLVKGIAELRK